MNKCLSAKTIGNYKSSNPKLYTEKLVGNVSACMGFIKANHTGRYVPNTILKVDIRNYTTGTAKVIVVFRKNKYENFYHECTYTAKNIDQTSIKYPEDFEYLSSLIH